MSARRARGFVWLAALGLAGCSATPDPGASTAGRDVRARAGAHAEDPEVLLVDGPIFVAPPRIDAAVEAARAARWPLPEPPEVELAAIAERWRAEVRRALFARGLALAAAPTPDAWILELELLHLAPSAAWLNAAGAEDRATAAEPFPIGISQDYALRNPSRTRELGILRCDGPLAGRRDESWSRAGERELGVGAAELAARLRAASAPAQ